MSLPYFLHTCATTAVREVDAKTLSNKHLVLFDATARHDGKMETAGELELEADYIGYV